jgi:hypothetical protein
MMVWRQVRGRACRRCLDSAARGTSDAVQFKVALRAPSVVQAVPCQQQLLDSRDLVPKVCCLPMRDFAQVCSEIVNRFCADGDAISEMVGMSVCTSLRY